MNNKDYEDYKSLNTNVKNKKTITIIMMGLLIIALTYRFFPEQQKNNQVTYRDPTPEEEKAHMEENHLIKLGNEYLWYNVKENREVKPITDVLERNCKNDFCKIENYFNYVKKIPYEAGRSNKDRNPVDIIMDGKGDCDEKSYLLASMMIVNNYESIILYTKDHAFIGLNIPNYDTDERRSFFTYGNKKYYYAETTSSNGYIGAYNGIDPKDFIHAYNVNEKKEIPLNELQANIYL